ncbi:LacI family transcriptional regulator [Halanaerobium congolense]|uniref:LacI family transcriptional regulator n=1 Tax=Halanaerobium congolense TaxID=54121 RepID=A0A318DTV9_9FIRM|nr:LacI family DNA-binding transcriptional regulator [Halanaerobium congolense]PXV60009.1 LacI family transcriptional regulator [Halanaerobium congolense]
MKITIKDIAEKANVSISTVSRVLNNKDDVNDNTRKQIKKIIDELGYNPSGIARGLALKKTNTIGLIIPNITNPFFPEVAKGVERRAEEMGYSVILYDTENDENKEKKALELMRKKQVDGIVLSFNSNTRNLINQAFDDKIPIVQIDRKINGLKCPSVLIDNFYSGYSAAKHLIDRGHRKIAHITGRKDILNSIERLSGYKKAFQEGGLKVYEKYIINGQQTIESGYKKMNLLLKMDQIPTAVFVANDLMAIGAYEAIFDKKMDIPKDISIIGHDDINMASIIRPKLTTVVQPKYDMGVNAVDLLVKLIGERKGIMDTVFKTKIIERNSVKNLKNTYQNA